MRICLFLATLLGVGTFCENTLAQGGSSSPYAMPMSSWAMPTSSVSSSFSSSRMRSPLASGGRSLNSQMMNNQNGLSPFGANRQPGQSPFGDPNSSPFRNQQNGPQPNNSMPQNQMPGPGRRPGSAPEENPSQAGGSGIRTELCVAFDHTSPDPNKISVLLTQRLAAMKSIHCLAPVRVEVQGQVALLRGLVETEHDRSLAGQIVLLEPGIAALRNEIAVSTTPASSTPR
jgi:hypothetical protein